MGPLGLGAAPGPGPATLELIPDRFRHHGQTQRKREVQWTDQKKDRDSYNIIYVQKIDDAYFDYTWKFGTEGPRPGTHESRSENLLV